MVDTSVNLAYITVMPSYVRAIVQGVPYHVTQRGNRQTVFFAAGSLAKAFLVVYTHRSQSINADFDSQNWKNKVLLSVVAGTYPLRPHYCKTVPKQEN
jgi:hypothetical protein